MLGEILESKGILSHEQINEALLELVSTGKRLGAFLVDAGLIDELVLTAALAEQFGLRVADLRREAPDPDGSRRCRRRRRVSSVDPVPR